MSASRIASNCGPPLTPAALAILDRSLADRPIAVTIQQSIDPKN
jgi:hypothetical protein